MSSFEESGFVDAAACGDVDGVKELLASKDTTPEQVNAIDKDGRSALHYACLNDDVKLLNLLIADSRCDVELCTPKGDSCLNLASLYASLEALKVLFLEPRASSLLNAQNNYGETALHLCAGSGDKSAQKAAKLLLDAGASLLLKDKWNRSPLDVAHDNAENPLVRVFDSYLSLASQELREQVEAQSKAHQEENQRSAVPELHQERRQALFGGGALGSALSGLKKTVVKEKHMFARAEGMVGTNDANVSHGAYKTQGKVLSKMIDFPGDLDEITKLLADDSVDPAGFDAFGLCALHKFASWNKVDFIELTVPKLTVEQLNAQDREGKTALHWACEMASVAAVKTLVENANIDCSIKDNKGRTALDIVNTGTGTVISRLRQALGAEL